MTTAIGPTLRVMASAGIRGGLVPDGRRIASGIGRGLARGDGRGWETSRGALRRITTGAGHSQVVDGSGCRGRSWCVRYGRRRWWRLWAAARDFIFRQEWVWAGFRWRREKCLFRDIA